VVTLVLGELYARAYFHNVVDDAMTSMQYAKNIALGNGAVFNVGERVEGYTNFLWMMLQVPLYWLSGGSGLGFVALVVHTNIAVAGAAVALLAALAHRVLDRVWALAYVLSLCVLDVSFSSWAAFGLENHLLAAAFLAALLLARSRMPYRGAWVGLMLVLAHLTRPDAGLFCAILVSNEVLEGLLERRAGRAAEARKCWRDAAVMTAVWVALYGAYFAWRYRYYGDLLPNTFYVKVGGPIDGWRRGVEYLHGFLSVRAWIPVLGLLAAAGVRDRTVRTTFVYLALHAIYVTYVGGDFFSGHRFFLAQIPLFALLVGVGLRWLARLASSPRVRAITSAAHIPPGALRAVALLVGLTLLGVASVRGIERGPYREEILAWRDNLTRNTRLFTWLHDHKPEGASIATCLIGHTGFFSDMRVVDVCGIIDTTIAHMQVASLGHGKPGHEKIGSVAYILSRRPTYVVPGYVAASDLWPLGYYFSGDMPADLAEGLWRRDERAERGGWMVPETSFTFDQYDARFTAAGDAFENWPSTRSGRGQGALVGCKGACINSYHPEVANEATGTLRSPPFELLGDWLTFRIGGGRDERGLRATLRVDDVPVASATGRHSDRLMRVEWDIRPLRGRSAVFEVVDDARGPWGYIAVDELEQWRD